jgi:hypothetical protein
MAAISALLSKPRSRRPGHDKSARGAKPGRVERKERVKVMATYKLLSSIVVPAADGTVLVAGQVVTDTGPGAQLPAGFIPNGCCDPQNADAAQKMWNAGPVIPTIDPFVPPPVTCWAAVSGTATPFRTYKLTGPLGVGFPAKFGGS